MGGILCVDALDVRAQPEFQELEKFIAGKAAASADLRGKCAVAREQAGVQRLVIIEARICSVVRVSRRLRIHP
jgi:hypothetical protein